jgi:hypothetical protein
MAKGRPFLSQKMIVSHEKPKSSFADNETNSLNLLRFGSSGFNVKDHFAKLGFTLLDKIYSCDTAC